MDWMNGEKFKLKRESFKEVDGSKTLLMYTQINQKIVSRYWKKFEMVPVDTLYRYKVDTSRQCPEET